MNKNLLIINTGGTINKLYNKINGQLYIPNNNTTIEEILSNYPQLDYKLTGIIYKDSLDISDTDRQLIAQTISNSNSNKIIIIHGTDTMNETSKFLDERFKDRSIILTGAMKPYEINNKEAIINIAMCIGFMKNSLKNGIHICMSGLIEEFNNIHKNRQEGIFENTKNSY